MYIHMVLQKTMFRKTETLVISKEIPNDFHKSTWIVSIGYFFSASVLYGYTGKSISQTNSMKTQYNSLARNSIAVRRIT